MKILPNSQSKIPKIMVSIYIIVSLLAFILMFATMATESLAGIFVVFVALPWSILFTSLIDNLAIDSIVLNTFLMAIGVIINASIIYLILLFFYTKK